MSVQRACRPVDPGAEPSVPGFTILGRIGRGAGSTVWSGRDLDTGVVYALKVASAVTGERLAVAARSEAREISLLRRLDHPHLVHLHRVVDLADGRRVLVLDLAEVGSLSDLLADRGPLCEGESSRLLAPVAQALAHVHVRGVVHGDVSAGNVLIAAGGRPLLGDLGVARLLPGAGGGVTRPAGPGHDGEAVAHETPGFGAPELAAGGPPTPASDIYSLGMVLKACLGGDAGSLTALVAACTAPDPTVRPGADLVERVLRLAASPGSLHPEPVPSTDRAVTRPVVAKTPDGARTEPRPEPGPVSRIKARIKARARSRTTSRTTSRTRFRSRRAGPGAVAAGLVLAVTAATVLVWCLPGGDPPATARPADPGDPVRAVHRLAADRARVLNSGSAAGLAAIDVKGSAAWRADAGLLSSMARRGIRLQGVRLEVISARLVRWEDEAAVVRTEIEISAHRRLAAKGAAEPVPASTAQVVDLVLQPDAEGTWRVRRTVLVPSAWSAGSSHPG